MRGDVGPAPKIARTKGTSTAKGKMADYSSEDESEEYEGSSSESEDWDSEDDDEEEDSEEDDEDEYDLPEEEDAPVLDKTGRQIRRPQVTDKDLQNMSQSEIGRVSGQIQSYNTARRQQRQAELRNLLQRYASEDK